MTKVLYSDDIDLHYRERRVGIIFLVIVALLTAVDIVEDTVEGASLLHTLTEMAVVAGALGGVVYLWRSAVRRYKQQHTKLSAMLSEVNRDLEHWREQSRQFTVGLSESIDKQLKSWGLTEAESDVAFLLIKGLSLKEIAEVRETSERTVRQQAAAIYAKSNLAGRAQLSAFFLEDLFDTRNRKD